MATLKKAGPAPSSTPRSNESRCYAAFVEDVFGLAALAGLRPEQGMYAAALAPVATALISSSPYLQAGPTAMTSLLTLGALTAMAMPFTDGYIALAALLALVVGVARIIIGILRAGVVSYLMSQPVVAGFTAAAGVLIVLSQVPAVLGVEVGPRTPSSRRSRRSGIPALGSFSPPSSRPPLCSWSSAAEESTSCSRASSQPPGWPWPSAWSLTTAGRPSARCDRVCRRYQSACPGARRRTCSSPAS
jgi:hypothetical protein